MGRTQLTPRPAEDRTTRAIPEVAGEKNVHLRLVEHACAQGGGGGGEGQRRGNDI